MLMLIISDYQSKFNISQQPISKKLYENQPRKLLIMYIQHIFMNDYSML